MMFVPVMIDDAIDDYDVFTIKTMNRWMDEDDAKANAIKVRKDSRYTAGVVDENGRIYSHEWDNRRHGFVWRHFGDIDTSDLDMKSK